jgi:hypothetical protein
MNLMNVRKGYADVVDFPEPGDQFAELHRLPDGRWLSVRCPHLAIRRSRKALLAHLEETFC